ncbi:hypothetical protein LCGC14_2041390 [marine sediment metagenome]|uniref:Uncharacterized protein n=1 Tax=marine sediment metagenome TaxID=412755 RepID=A0A0F9FEE5_9ZZZZ
MARTKRETTQSKHIRMMIGLGFKSGIRNYATYLHKLEYSKRWNKLHHKAICAASHKYYVKIQAELGNQGRLTRPLYAMNHAAEKIQKRKDRANEAREKLFRLQRLRPNRHGGRSTSPLTISK